MDKNPPTEDEPVIVQPVPAPVEPASPPTATVVRQVESLVLASAVAAIPVVVALGWITQDQGASIGVVLASIAAGLHLPQPSKR